MVGNSIAVSPSATMFLAETSSDKVANLIKFNAFRLFILSLKPCNIALEQVNSLWVL